MDSRPGETQMTTHDETLSIAPSLAENGQHRSGPRRRMLRLALAGAGVLGVAWIMALMHLHFRLHAPDWPLLAAQPFAIKLHLATILPAFAVGCVLMMGVKGDMPHRVLGWAWVVLMTTSAGVSFFIHTINPNGLSVIHALSAWVVVAAPFGLYLARAHKVVAHRRMMTGLFLFGLGVAGAFTFLPGRLMFQMFFS
jgi:uncharacterized membrane protein